MATIVLRIDDRKKASYQDACDYWETTVSADIRSYIDFMIMSYHDGATDD